PSLIRSASSTGSSSTSRSAEGVAVRQPSKSSIRRHTNRLSGVFLRVISADPLIADDPSELSNQISAPGILKIFGNEICEGAHYKSVLATTHSSAKELVKEALERYGLGKEEAESYVLCDAIGSISEHQWRTEGFRVVGDNEKPLLLQSLWKPREGLARRFEIQRRSLVEEKTSRDKDTITAGINAQARKLQKSRSRVTSTLIHRTVEQNHIHKESQREGMESSDDNATQYAIHPPHDCPYLLLLQGCSPTQDFLIYLLVGLETVIGRRSDHEDGSKPDILLFANDILRRHCCFHRRSPGGPTVLCPSQDAVVTRNGEVLREKVRLNPGDVIGLGQHYLFLFKDPVALIWSAVPWMLGHSTSTTRTSPTTDKILCNSCISPCTDPQSSKEPLSRGPPFLQSPEGHSLTLNYDPEDEDRIVREIVAMGSTRVKDRPVLTAAFLLCMCVQYSSTCLHTSDLRRLLLLTASGIQRVMWVSYCKEMIDSNSEDLQPLSLPEVISGLRPLVVWMSNSLELLQFIQYQLPLILEWRSRKEQGQEEDEEREDDETSEETMAVLEEVVMLAFQQCVYYVTKVLYPILPGLLDCNPFRESPGESSSGPQVPAEIQQVVEVLNETWVLLSDCQLHPEISSQLIGYVFYFINASLVNSLMERGSEPGFYQWSRGVRIRANLDLVLDWAHAAGQGEPALEHTHTLSSAINLLATPRKNLLQVTHTHTHTHTHWSGLIEIYSTSPCRHMWTPSAQDEAAAHGTADVLESFDTHHPLVLPAGGYQLQVRRAVTDPGLRDQLDKLRAFIPSPPEPRSSEVTSGSCLQETLHNHPPPSALPPSPPSPPSPLSTHYLDEFSSCGAVLLSQKLRHLELQIREMTSSEVRRSALDPSCLLTPPNTPHCLSALRADRLTSDCPHMKKIKEEEGEQEEEEEEEEEDHYDDSSNEIFSLELERGERGLGLALVDTRDTSFRVKGVFIRAVVPDSPAARCEKLVPGDRILAVNGVSLLGLDYESGKELIQSSGDRLRLLLARCDWMAKAIQTDC
uniref:Ras-associating and dilute domain-containing protein-like n=1 Tax=Seriola dumerili TaxID=41447 RepID=A0A3B4UAV2_SERDU